MPSTTLLLASLALGLEPALIDQVMADALRHWHCPGAAVVIVRDGKVVHARGYGVREQGRDAVVTADTVFPIASCTKAFTATLRASLVDQKRLSWDDPVRRHLPSFQLHDPLASADCRLRDLLCHRTGVAAHDLLWYRAPWPASESIRRTGLLPASQPFRAAFQYQSVMVMAAGEVAARVGGQPWHTLLQSQLLTPLGMTNTHPCDTFPHPDRAVGHRLVEGQLQLAPAYPQPEANAAGSLHSSARDLGKWLLLQLEGRSLGRRILSAQALRETHTPHMPLRLDPGSLERQLNPDTVQLNYALGWVVQDYRGHRQLSHAGAIDGFRAHVVFWPEDRCGVALLMNLERTRMNLAVANTLGDLLLGHEPRDWNAHFGTIAAAEDLARRQRDQRWHAGRQRPIPQAATLAGRYDHPAYGELELTAAGESLTARWADFRGPVWPLEGRSYILEAAQLAEPELTFDTENPPTWLDAFGVRFTRRRE